VDGLSPSFTTTDGATISFSDVGEGRPLLFVPGICCSRRWWNRQTGSLAGPLRAIATDLRGLGASPPVRHGHRIARYGADVAELMEHLNVHDAVLLGWSVGSSASLSLVELAGQDRLAGLVLVEGSASLLNGPDRQLGIADPDEGMRMREAFGDAWEETVTALVADMFAQPAGDPELPELLADALSSDPEATARLFWDHLNQDWRDVLRTIRVPTLVVAGSASSIGESVGAANHMAAAIPDARLEVFTGAGHALFREQPERFNELVKGFTSECARATR
jgi:non-heme chloroperoxidase